MFMLLDLAGRAHFYWLHYQVQTIRTSKMLAIAPYVSTCVVQASGMHLQHAAQTIKPNGSPRLHAAFIDFKQAYDTIPNGLFPSCRNGYPEKNTRQKVLYAKIWAGGALLCKYGKI